MSVTTRPAVPADAALILDFIRSLADYEKLLHQVSTTEDDVRTLLFCLHPRAFCDIAEVSDEPVGFALWFYSVSTFAGRHGIYLEDLYVRPQSRSMGAGKALLAGLANRCLAEGLPRLEWQVLNWNAPAIAFYDSLEAAAMTDWTTRRLSGEALSALAKAAATG